MTNLSGCFAAGECEYQYHGANRLGANSLLSCIYGGLVTGVEVDRYVHTLTGKETPSSVFESALKEEENKKDFLLNASGSENVHQLHQELANIMIGDVSVKRNNEDLKQAIERIKAVRERADNITLDDHSRFANQTYIFAAQFKPMLEVALIIAKGALLRDEFRGAHYKPEFPKRDDKHWLKETIATYDPEKDEPKISYNPIDIRHLEPIQRDYAHAKKVKPTLKNVPSNIVLPFT